MKSLYIEKVGPIDKAKVDFGDLTVLVGSQATITQNISFLDPGSINQDEFEWGGLTEFSGHVAEIVSSLYKDE